MREIFSDLTLLPQNQFINGLGVCALGNVGSSEMCAALAPEIERMLGSGNPYIKKKAALCAIRTLEKVDDMEEKFTPRVRPLLEDRSHSCQLTGITMMMKIISRNIKLGDQDAAADFQECLPILIRILKNMLMSGYANAAEYDVAGGTDPFLQCQVLKALGMLGKRNPEASDEMNEILAQVACNTEGAKNAGNAILYECSQTIFQIEAETGLRSLAIGTLGTFLTNRDNNIR
jgi:AP-1 complex subunit gamma-1